MFVKACLGYNILSPFSIIVPSIETFIKHSCYLLFIVLHLRQVSCSQLVCSACYEKPTCESLLDCRSWAKQVVSNIDIKYLASFIFMHSALLAKGEATATREQGWGSCSLILDTFGLFQMFFYFLALFCSDAGLVLSKKTGISLLLVSSNICPKTGLNFT